MTLSPKQWVLAGLFVAYSAGLWYLASTITEAGYKDAKIADQTKVINSQNKAIAVGEKVATLEQEAGKKQKTIEKEVIREIEKPVYHECPTTDNGMRLIDQAIDTANGKVPAH